MASPESTLVNSIVGSGTFFKGQIDVSGLLRIDGDFSGSLKTAGRIIIGRNGRADCTIDAATVVIGGVFRGTIYASEKVIALDTAIILGNVFAPRLIAESGVVMDGTMHVRGTHEGAENDRPDRSIGGETGRTEGRDGKRKTGRRSGKRRVPLGNL